MPSELSSQTHELLGEVHERSEPTLAECFSPREDSSGIADMEDAAYGGEDAFFNDSRAHVYKRQKEQPKHRLLAYLIASGKSNRETAKLLNMSYQWVIDVQREPWVRQRIQEEMKLAGRDGIQTLLVGAAEDSVYRLIKEQDNEEAKPAERISAANSILNRLFGNPTQPIAHSGKIDASKMSDEELMKLCQNAEVISGNV